MKSSLRAFWSDDRGTTVLETLVVFLPVMSLFYANIEIIMAYYAVVSAQKAAQLAARIAATESPIYIGNDMPLENVLNDAVYVDNGPACFQPSGIDGCLDPHIERTDEGVPVLDEAGNPARLAFECTRSEVMAGVDDASGDENCDRRRFQRLLCEVQRFYPSIGAVGRGWVDNPDPTKETNDDDRADVSIRYDYRRLGIAGGPFVPEITVRVLPRDLPIDLIGVLGFATLSNGLGNAVSSSIGEDLFTPDIVDVQPGWCEPETT